MKVNFIDNIAFPHFLFDLYSFVEKSYEETSYSFNISFTLNNYLYSAISGQVYAKNSEE